MTYKLNTFKSITKGLIGPNIIFPAACILLGADMCGISNTAGKVAVNHFDGSSKPRPTPKPKKPNRPVSLTSLWGRATALNLGDGYQCGVFVASETKEALLIKLPEGGWRQIAQQPQQGGQGRLRVDYDAVDAHIIKIDDAVLKQLIEESNSNQNVWDDIEFFDQGAIGDSPIFTKDGISSSTEFTSVNNLTSNRLLISSSIPPAALKDVKNGGFVLVKDKHGLMNLLKTMLEGGTEAWEGKVGITEDYIICPAALDGGVLQFDSSDLELSLQGVRLEDYTTTYCYLKQGEKYCLIPLKMVESLVEIDKEEDAARYYYEPVNPIAGNSTTVISSEQTTVTPSEQTTVTPSEQTTVTPSEQTTVTPSEEPVGDNSVVLETNSNEQEMQTENLSIPTTDTNATITNNPNNLLPLTNPTLDVNLQNPKDQTHGQLEVQTSPMQHTGSLNSRRVESEPLPPPSPTSTGPVASSILPLPPLPPLATLDTNGLARLTPPPPPPPPPPPMPLSPLNGSYNAKTNKRQKSNSGSITEAIDNKTSNDKNNKKEDTNNNLLVELKDRISYNLLNNPNNQSIDERIKNQKEKKAAEQQKTNSQKPDASNLETTFKSGLESMKPRLELIRQGTHGSGNESESDNSESEWEDAQG